MIDIRGLKIYCSLESAANETFRDITSAEKTSGWIADLVLCHTFTHSSILLPLIPRSALTHCGRAESNLAD